MYIPQEKEILLNDVSWTVSRRFDTLVLGSSCRAYELTRGLPSSSVALHRRIFTDRFGEIRSSSAIGSSEEGECYLTSAVVRDTAYNRDTSRIRYFDFCLGNRAQERHYLDGHEEITWREVTIDSVMAGHTWYHLPGNMRGKFGQPLAGWLRWDEDGLHRYDETRGYDSLLLRSDASLGDWCQWGIINDTSSVLEGSLRRRLLKARYDLGVSTEASPGWSVHLLEGVGLTRAEWNAWEWDKEYELLYAEVCGNTWGIPLSVSTPTVLPDDIDFQVYPNPARGTTRFTLRSAGPVPVALYDLLGRRLKELHVFSDGRMASGTIDLQGMQPGVYLITVHSRETFRSVNLIVME
jgi:hypothetical protein